MPQRSLTRIKRKTMAKKDYSNWTEALLTAQIEEIEWHKI
jgi:hypothetical protein